MLSSPATGGYAGPPDLALFRLNLKQEDGAPLLSQLRLPYRDEVHQHHPLLVAIDPVSRLKTKMALSIEVEGFWLATSDLQTVPGQSGSPIVDPESGVLKMLVKGWGGQELVAQGVGRAAEMDALAILTSIDPLLEHLPEGLDPHRMNKSRATAVVISSSDAIQAIGLDDVRTAAITHVDTNPGTPLNIVGDAGSGKSTLLASILSEVSRSRSVVFTAADADDDMIAMIRGPTR